MTTVVTSFTNAAFGEGVGPIWMSNLTCVSNSPSLFQCTRQVQIGWVENTTTCSHSNDVAVRCQPRNGTWIFLNFYPLTLAIKNECTYNCWCIPLGNAQYLNFYLYFQPGGLFSLYVVVVLGFLRYVDIVSWEWYNGIPESAAWGVPPVPHSLATHSTIYLSHVRDDESYTIHTFLM